MKNKKRLLAMLLSGTIMLTMLASCSSDSEPAGDDAPADVTSEAGTEDTAAPADGELIPITAMLFDRANTPESEGTVDNNRWTEFLNEELAERGGTVSYVTVPRSEEATKIPVMMASGTAADIMMMYNSSLVADFYNDGGTYDFAPYMDAAPQMLEYIGEDVIAMGRNAEGEQWGIPARRSTVARTNAFIREDWLTDLGMEIPETVEDFYDAMVAFKNENPDGVDPAQVVAYSTNNHLFRYTFSEPEFLNSNDYLIYYEQIRPYADEGFVEYLKFANQLYNEGLMDPEYFAHDDFGQTQKEQMVAGQLGYLEADANYNVDTLRGSLLQNLQINDPDAEMVSMLPLQNVHDGEVYNRTYPETGAFLFMPKTAENPEMVMQYLDVLSGDAGFAIFHGIEGEHFEYVDGVPVVIDAEHNATTKDYHRHDLFLVGNQGYYQTEEEFIAATAKELPGYEEYVTANYSNAAAGIRLPNVDYVSPTQAEQHANYSTIYNDYMTRIITGAPEDVEATFEEMRAEYDKYEIDIVVEERTAYFEALFG